TEYGLAGAVWTNDASRAQRVAGALRHGTVWINDYHPYLPQAEWGGFGKSGIGRELGPTGLDEELESTHIYPNTERAPLRRAAGALRDGTVWINDYHPYLPQAEWGGFGKSGIGRELGPTGLDEYRESKHIYQNTRPAPLRWCAGNGGV